eukprot:TRINITY_DN15129_c0_g1_i1.p1 TRINITY_DN15129_c0_g1~~TRINITY_DN15129_c0_g1_i1.p1  ORF type:complete len:171 (+),score=40.50 TRINITY_DN15129_c0_g1_i1:431-943(+)
MAFTKAKTAGKATLSKGKDPFVPVTPLKHIFPLYADRKTKLLALDDVPFVLRAMGLSIYAAEELKIREQVEKIDGMGKPVSFKTLSDWCEENSAAYVRSVDDAYSALGTLCHEGIIGKSDNTIIYPWLRHLASEVGDKINVEKLDKTFKGQDGLKGDEVALDDFVKFLQK